MRRLRLLHLSDLHISNLSEEVKHRITKNFLTLLGEARKAVPGRMLEWIPSRLRNASLGFGSQDALGAVARFIYENRERIDAILISGDIAFDGSENQLKEATKFFTLPTGLSYMQWLSPHQKPTLSFFNNEKIILMPGNHDRMYSFIRGKPGNTLFDYHFGAYWGSGRGGVQRTTLPVNKAPILTILSCDFSLTRRTDCTAVHKLNFYGQGKVYNSRLRKLVRETKEVKRLFPDCGVIWMIHFAPELEGHYGLDEELRLIDSGALIRKAEKHRVKYILCGHTHVAASYPKDDSANVKMLCAGTSTCISDDDTTIHWRDIEIEKGEVRFIKTINFKYDSALNKFRLKPLTA